MAATVAGSAVIQANLPNDVNFYMDCQPGETIVTRPPAGAGTSFTPLVAAPFASVAVAGTASNPGGVPATPSGAASQTRPARAGRIESRSLVAERGKVRLRVSCAAGARDCAGTVRLRTSTPVRIGRRRPALVNLARALKYTVQEGRSRTVVLVLSADGKRLLLRRATHRVRVSLAPAKGTAVARNLTLRRG